MASYLNVYVRGAAKFSRSMLICVTSACLLSLASCKSAKSIAVSDRYDNIRNEHSAGVSNKHCGRLIEEAYTWVGTPYKYACAEKGTGADCSGFVMKVFHNALGYDLPRNSAKQAEFCHSVEEGNVETGDLVFFATGENPQKVSHVGIMVDNVQFIHASSSKGVVVSNMTTPYYKRTFIKYGRVPQTSASK